MIAQGAALLTIILVIWTWGCVLKTGAGCAILALAALGIGHCSGGILGGITDLFYRPPAVSGACRAAQTFQDIAVAIALFTGKRWIEEQPPVEFDQRRPSLFTLTLLSIFVLYVQLILGAMFRHHGLSWWPHVVHAVVVSFVLAWTAVRALTVYLQIEEIRRPAIVMLSLVIAQLCLGFTAFLTRVAWGRDAVQPELPMVVATVAHVALGALLLATTVILAIQVWRQVPVAFEERLPQPQSDASVA